VKMKSNFSRKALTMFTLLLSFAVLALLISQSPAKTLAQPRKPAVAPAHSGKLTFDLDPYPVRGPVHWSSINKEMRDLYTLNGKIPVRETYYFLNENGIPPVVEYPEAIRSVWRKAELEAFLERAKRRDTNDLTGYGPSAPRDVYAAIDAFPVEGKSVLVIGTQVPWIEAIVWAYGKAKEVWTVDFNKPISELPQFKTLSIPELEVLGRKFDVIFSFSSIEHDGLGRYGDPLNPTADLQRMKKIKNFIEHDGLFYFAVPVGLDALVFNAHRVYGEARFPKLIEGWELLGHFDQAEYPHDYFAISSEFQQPVHVLRPIWDD